MHTHQQPGKEITGILGRVNQAALELLMLHMLGQRKSAWKTRLMTFKSSTVQRSLLSRHHKQQVRHATLQQLQNLHLEEVLLLQKV